MKTTPAKQSCALFVHFFLVAASSALAENDLALWYRQPASVPGQAGSNWGWANSAAWLQALPVGNGRLGAMVFGGLQQERIQLNEDSLWSGGPQ